MSQKYYGLKLISELLTNPEIFNKEKKAYDLLNAYLSGLSIETLIPLLQSKEKLILEPAIWIASELGHKNKLTLSNTIPLLNSSERFIRYYSLECVALGSSQEKSKYFYNIIIKMSNDQDRMIRVHAMHLVTNANSKQLNESIYELENKDRNNFNLHTEGIKLILSPKKISFMRIKKMLESNDDVTQKYGIIIAAKFFSLNPNTIETAAASHPNLDVKQFAEEIIKLNS